MGDSSVKVAVRVRPFNNREKQEGAVLCVDMQGKMTKVFSPELTKEFYFDYSYWSHDGFVEDGDSGMMVPDGPGSKYADQQRVFDDLGVGVLNNAFEGYHCCLFAYGQTGSGKSYSMVGYGKNKGIIPIVCQEIFNRIEAAESPKLHCEVTASMLEIYNEQIQDLVKPPSERVKGGLKIREDPKLGVYVQDLLKTPCASYEEISEILDKGNNNRTVAATQMNATSSRAHTVLTIGFTQILYDDSGKPFNRKQSNINLVDLAGSERASKTGATGDTLKEGSNINKSLSTLGRVITALAKRSAGSKEMIPYRESSLTRILQNALGGNSKTTMIAAISPATFNIDETISTLRYADQVKSIKNQAIINETPQEKLIRELKEENEKLKAMLEGKAIPGKSGEETDRIREEFERQIEELRRAKEEAERTYQEKVKEPLKERRGSLAAVPTHKPVPSKIELKTPHLSNLNEDPLLSGHICHGIKLGRNVVGRKNPASQPDVIIEGLGIGIDHCVITLENETYTILPSPDANLKTTVNGKLLTQSAVLQHHDRVRFGNHNYFLFVDPEELSNSHPDWEFAMNETHEEEVKLLLGKQDEELKAKEDEMKKKLEAEMEEIQRKIEEEKKQLEEQARSKSNNTAESRKVLAAKEKELRDRHRAMAEEMRKKEQLLKTHEENRLALEELKKQLTHAIHQINEANERAVFLGRNVMYQPELYREGVGIAKGLKNTKVRIRVVYPELSEDFKIYWSSEKLDARLVDMQDICNQLEYGANIEDIDLDYDPFSDQADSLSSSYHLIGHAYVYLEAAYYLSVIEDDQVAIINDQGQIMGTLNISLNPLVEGVIMEEFESLRDLVSKELTFTVQILQANSLPPNFSTNVFCQYTMSALNEEVFKTEMLEETNANPKFGYFKAHRFIVTGEVADEFLSRALTISVYGDITRERKEKELRKLMEHSKTNITLIPGVKIGMELTEEDIEEELMGLSKGQEKTGFLNVSQGVNESHTMMLDATTDTLRAELKNREKELRAVEEEYKRKERDAEKQIQKRIKEIEKREQAGNNPPQRGSSCCLTF
jgi:kinesin family member 13